MIGQGASKCSWDKVARETILVKCEAWHIKWVEGFVLDLIF